VGVGASLREGDHHRDGHEAGGLRRRDFGTVHPLEGLTLRYDPSIGGLFSTSSPAPHLPRIHRSAWNRYSANFAFPQFSEVGLVVACRYTSPVG
jgi:hypothetical protein